MEETTDPALSRLITEQDRLYQQVVDLRALHDVIEEVLQKASTNQITACYSFLSCSSQEVLSKVGGQERSVGGGGQGSVIGVTKGWLTEFQEVMFDIGAVAVNPGMV